MKTTTLDKTSLELQAAKHEVLVLQKNLESLNVTKS
jgi:hypothetical protein